MILTCSGCGDQFGGPKTMSLHLSEVGCLNPKDVGLTRYGAKVWRKASPQGAATVRERRVPHRMIIEKRARFEG